MNFKLGNDLVHRTWTIIMRSNCELPINPRLACLYDVVEKPRILIGQIFEQATPSSVYKRNLV